MSRMQAFEDATTGSKLGRGRRIKPLMDGTGRSMVHANAGLPAARANNTPRPAQTFTSSM